MQNAILANVAVVQSHCLPLPLPLALALALAHCIPLALAMPQFKCRLTHCDAIASFLPFCFLSQIVCALEQAKVEHVSALPLSTCHLPLATWRTISGASTLPSYDILFNGTKGRPCLWQRQRKNLGLICRFSFQRKWGKST